MNTCNNQRRFDVVIIGAGFAGSATALQIARCATRPVRVLLLDRDGAFGRGLAYRMTAETHLLNVPKHLMGAWPDRIGEFADSAGPHEDAFVTRSRYGDYLEALLKEAAKNGGITQVADEAIDLVKRAETFSVTTRRGPIAEASSVVLALGNFPPSRTLVGAASLTSPRYVEDPLHDAALDRVENGDIVLVAGSGLTALDCIVSLHRRRPAKIHVVSRRGLLPHAHTWSSETFNIAEILSGCDHTAGKAFRLVRVAIKRHAAHGGDWRDVIDALRPVTQELWSRFDLRERRRFMRHVRPYWEKARHRCAPQVLAEVQGLIDSGFVEVDAARITQLIATNDALVANVVDRRTQAVRKLRASWLFNCTGPENDCFRVDNPLVKNLLRRGLIDPHPTRLGIQATPLGHVIGRDGIAVGNLFAIGSLLKGVLYETTAVPEIRHQARNLGERCAHLVRAAGAA